MVSPQSTITCFTFCTCIQCTVVLWCWNRWNDGTTFVQRCRFIADLRRKFEIKTTRRRAAALWTFGFTRGLSCHAVCVKLDKFVLIQFTVFLNRFFSGFSWKVAASWCQLTLHCVAKKLHPFYFLNNSVKSHSILIIFITQIPEWICNKTVTKISTSPNECHYTTLWNTTCQPVHNFITTVVQAWNAQTNSRFWINTSK